MKAFASTKMLKQNENNLIQILKAYESVAVALSGGVDSAVVAKAAYLACGEKAVAVTASSPSLASGELELAQQLSSEIGIRHQVIETSEFEVKGYQQNAGNRCYFCKTELYQYIEEILPELNVNVICNGANTDDQGDHRPGMQAAQEHAVRSPLIEAGLSKSDVRELAKHWDLEVWDKPAMPCLSSRVAYGVEVTPERVRMVDQAESFLRSTFPIRELRVRYHSENFARIEVPVASIQLLTSPEALQLIVDKFHEIGFKYVTVDLEGFRSGNLNQVLEFVDFQPNSSASSS